MAEPLRFRFDELPHAVRERLVEVLTHRDSDPRVLAFEKRSIAPGWWKLPLVVGLVLAGVTLKYILVNTTHGDGPDGKMFVLFGAGMCSIAAAVVNAVLWQQSPRPPWSEGRYAFASGAFDCRGGWVSWAPSATWDPKVATTYEPRAGERYSTLSLAPGQTFWFASSDLARSTAATLAEARGKFAAALAARDHVVLAALDPVYECSLANRYVWPPEPGGPRLGAWPPALRLWKWGIPVAIGAALAAALRLLLA